MIEKVLDLLWPRTCEVCGRPADRPGRHLCSDCVNRIPFVPLDGCCRVCGRAVEGLEGEYLCEDCSRPSTRPVFDGAASAVRFEGGARKAVHDYKFNRHLWLREDFTDWMEAACRARFDVAAVDAVLPMPLTRWHRLDRGYNQSAYLAKALARRLDRRYLGDVLKRQGHPTRQAGLDEAARRENVAGTFRVARREVVAGRTLLLVDDVMATGATLSEASKALKECGSWRIWCVTLARSIRD